VSDRLQHVRAEIADHLAEIATLFRSTAGVKLTLLARTPSHPDGSRDLVVSDDDLTAASDALLRLNALPTLTIPPDAGARRDG
jgi:hypothetical protein